MKKSRHEYREFNEYRNFNFWGAVLGGFITALSVLFLLNLLGLGIGLATVNPLQETNPAEGLGLGAIIWWSISNLIALFVGGLVAGRIAGTSDTKVGGIHGFIAWGIYTLFSVWMVFSGVGSIIGGVTGAASNLFSSNQDAVTVNVNDEQKKSTRSADMSIDRVKSNIRRIVNAGERFNVLPDDASAEVNEVLDVNKQDIKRTMRDLNIEENVDEFFNDLTFDLDDEGNLDIRVEGDGEYFEKTDLKEYLSENTELTEQEINGLITKWEKKIDQAVEKAEELYREAKQEAEEAAAKTADAIAKFSIWAFLALLVGAGIAFYGGTLGTADRRVNRESVDSTVVE